MGVRGGAGAAGGMGGGLMARQPTASFQNDNNYPIPDSGGGDDMAAPLGALYLFSNAPGTGQTPAGLTVDTDGTWGDWETYVAFAGSTVTVVADCFLSVYAEANITTPQTGLAQFIIETGAWFTNPNIWFANPFATTITPHLNVDTPIYPFAAGFTIKLKVQSAPTCPATAIQWVVTVWAPTPPGFVVPGA